MAKREKGAWSTGSEGAWPMRSEGGRGLLSPAAAECAGRGRSLKGAASSGPFPLLRPLLHPPPPAPRGEGTSGSPSPRSKRGRVPGGPETQIRDIEGVSPPLPPCPCPPSGPPLPPHNDDADTKVAKQLDPF